jgi:hypothetical protein
MYKLAILNIYTSKATYLTDIVGVVGKSIKFWNIEILFLRCLV